MNARRPPSILPFALILCLGCEAESEDQPQRGELVYSGPNGSLYRLDRRVEDVPSEPADSSSPGCGYLTARAEADIDRILDSLDPAAKYAIDVEACERRWGQDASSTSIHIDGFTHSPFVCAGLYEECCAEALVPLEALYVRVDAYLEGHGEENDAALERLGIETYPMIESDEPCRPPR